jgi:hypothetical protein
MRFSLLLPHLGVQQKPWVQKIKEKINIGSIKQSWIVGKIPHRDSSKLRKLRVKLFNKFPEIVDIIVHIFWANLNVQPKFQELFRVSD